jgi:hypothetical protein
MLFPNLTKYIILYPLHNAAQEERANSEDDEENYVAFYLLVLFPENNPINTHYMRNRPY